MPISPGISYGVDAVNGNDSTGNGSTGNPWKTLAKFVAVVITGGLLQSTDILNLTGDFHESNVISTAIASGFTIQQWPGMPTYRIHGGVDIKGNTWTASGSGYTTNIGTGKSDVLFFRDWETHTVANGSHAGLLTTAADAATALATANNVFYNSGTGLVSINVGADPGTLGSLYYTGNGLTGLSFTNNLSNAVITDYSGCLWTDNNAGAPGYALQINGQNNTITINRLDDNGYHGIGFTCGGRTCLNNRIGGGIVAGLANSGGALVFRSDTDGSTGNSASNVYIYAHTHLLYSSSLPVSGRAVGGCYSHNNGTGGVTSATWTGITADYWTGEAGDAFNCSDTATPNTTAEEDYRNFSVQFIQCTLKNGRHTDLTGGCAFNRCRLFHTTDDAIYGFLFTVNSTITVHFSFCDVIMSSPGGTTAIDGFVFIGASGYSARIVCINGSHIFSTGTAASKLLFMTTGGVRVALVWKMRDCITSFEQAAVTWNAVTWSDNDASFNSGAAHDFQGGTYYGQSLISLNSNLRATNTTWNTSKVETNATTPPSYPISSPFASPAINGILKASSSAYTTRRTRTGIRVAMYGINGLVWNGTPGSFQTKDSGWFSRTRYRATRARAA